MWWDSSGVVWGNDMDISDAPESWLGFHRAATDRSQSLLLFMLLQGFLVFPPTRIILVYSVQVSLFYHFHKCLRLDREKPCWHPGLMASEIDSGVSPQWRDW
jgi:hypothetical protein